MNRSSLEFKCKNLVYCKVEKKDSLHQHLTFLSQRPKIFENKPRAKFFNLRIFFAL